MEAARFGVIDIGSYELVLKIFEFVSGKKVRVTDDVRYVLELGRETYTRHSLCFETIEKLCEVLLGFRKILEEYHVTECDVVATSGLREADNARLILDRIYVRTGFRVTIISNSEQRLVTYKALAMYPEELEEFSQGNTAILEVGSGSIQISLLDKKNIASTQNIKIGSLRISELLYRLGSNLVDVDGLLDEIINNDLQTFKRIFMKDKRIDNLIATGDQITLFTRNPEKGGFERRMTAEDFVARYRKLKGMSERELAKELQMSGKRALFLLLCVRIYGRMIELVEAKQIWIPGTDICDGMAIDFALRKKKISAKHDFREDIINEVRGIAKRYKEDVEHTAFVGEIAGNIFQLTRKLHGMGKKEKLLLESAALIHGCGKYISIQNAGESAYHIIMATEIIGLSHCEREMLAKVVKYNTLPTDGEEDLTVIKLTAILRVANALDRSHKQKMKGYRLELRGDEMWIHTKTREDLTLELGLFDEKAALFQEVYGLKVLIRQKKFDV